MCVCMWMWVCVCVCACVCVCVCVSVCVFAGVHALAWARMCSSGWWNDLWCRVARVRVTSEGFSLSFILLLMWNDFTWGKIYNVGETFQREGSSGAASVLYTYRTNRLDYDSCFKTSFVSDHKSKRKYTGVQRRSCSLCFVGLQLDVCIGSHTFTTWRRREPPPLP